MHNNFNLNIENYIRKGALCPLDADEETKNKFLRAIGIKKSEESKTKFNANIMAEFIRANANIISLDGECLAIHNGKFYEILKSKSIIKHIIHELLNSVGKYWTTQREKEVFESLKCGFDCHISEMDAANVINLQNGVLNLDTLELESHSPKHYCSSVIETNYDVNSKCPRWLKFLNQIFNQDQERIDLLQEFFGSCISNQCTGKAAIFYGSGMNGKSVVAAILQSLIGENAISHLPLNQFESPFGLQGLIGKRLNVPSELETGDYKLSTANFKAVCTGDPVHINIKYEAPIETVLNCKLLFLTNNLPDTLDTSYGFFRRLIIFPFDYTVKEDEKDMNLSDKLKSELSGILNWAIEGLERLERSNYNFTKCEAAENCLKIYKNEQNNVGDFFTECFIIDNESEIRKSELYCYYTRYCFLNGMQSVSRRDFWVKLKSHLAQNKVRYAVKKNNGIEYIVGFKVNREIDFEIPTVEIAKPEDPYEIKF